MRQRRKQREKWDLEAKQSREDGVKEEVKAKDKHDEKYDLGNKKRQATRDNSTTVNSEKDIKYD